MLNFEQKRKELITLCQQVMNMNDIILQGDYHSIIKKLSDSLCERVKNINKYCEVESYDIFFNGKIGAGKSTAICSILGLMNDSIKDSKLRDLFLLKTGTGRTTICETEIIFSDNISSITVEPVEYEEFKIYIHQFEEWLKDSKSDIPIEHIRLLKNMIGIDKKYKEVDEILEHYEELKINASEYIKSKIDYEKRTDTLYIKGNQSFQEWLKNTYKNINDGIISTCPMPKKIVINICKKDMNIDIPQYIHSIIDTRGIDLGERIDIQEYISRENSISFMCDNVKDLGSNPGEMSILKQILIKENKDTKLRVGFLCLAHNGELEDITDCETREEGISEKKSQLLKKIKEEEIYFKEENIFFYEAAKGFKFEEKKVVSILDNEVISNRKKFFENIDKMIFNMYNIYKNEVLDVLKILNTLETGQVNDKILENFQKSISVVDKFKKDLNIEDILKKFKEEVVSIYHSSLRGAVNHYGIGNTADVYGSFKKGRLLEFKDKCEQAKSNIVAAIEEIFDTDNFLEKICCHCIIEKIDEVYKKLYNDCGNFTYYLTKETLYNYKSWQNPKHYWGDGKGNYNSRVWEDIYNEIVNSNIETELKIKKFEEELFKEIKDFLNIKA